MLTPPSEPATDHELVVWLRRNASTVTIFDCERKLKAATRIEQLLAQVKELSDDFAVGENELATERARAEAAEQQLADARKEIAEREEQLHHQAHINNTLTSDIAAARAEAEGMRDALGPI